MNARTEQLPAVIRYRRAQAGQVEVMLSCPFCGSSGDGADAPRPMELDSAPALWAVVCQCCGAIGPSDERRAAAAALWNGAAARVVGVETAGAAA